MIPVLERSDVVFGLANNKKEIIKANKLRVAIYKSVGFYNEDVIDDTDDYDIYSYVFIVKNKVTDEVISSARYTPGEKRLPIEEAFKFILPKEVAHIPKHRRLEGGKLVSSMRLDRNLASIGLICTAFFYLKSTKKFDMTLHTTIDSWAKHVVEAGFKFNHIENAELIYSRDAVAANYFYNNPVPVRAYYVLIDENIDVSIQYCEQLSLSIKPDFLRISDE